MQSYFTGELSTTQYDIRNPESSRFNCSVIIGTDGLLIEMNLKVTIKR